MAFRSWMSVRIFRIFILMIRIAFSYRLHYAFSPFYGPAALERRRSRLHLKNALRFRDLALRLKGILIKLGQFMSARVDLLPEEYTRILSQLQDAVPPANYSGIKRRIREELGADFDEMFSVFNEIPIAAASLGQVHEAVLKNGLRVAVKVQYPGIRTIVETDLRAARWAAFLLQRFLKQMRFDVLYEEFSRVLHSELDYIREGRNAERFREQFKDDTRILVPRVIWEYTTPHVLTLEFMDGIKISEFESIRAAGIDLPVLARLLMESYINQLFAHRFLHGDPHPGNLFVRPGAADGPKLIFVDFGLMQALTQTMREGIKTTVAGIIDRDIPRIVAGLIELGFISRGGDTDSIERVAAFFIEKYRDISPKAFRTMGIGDIAQDLQQIFTLSSTLQIPNNFILIWRTLGMLNGINSRLDPDLNIIELAKPFAVPFIRDDEDRWSRLWSRGRDAADALMALPRAMADFLLKANRGEFETRMSSQDVTGAILKLHRLILQAILAAFILALAVLGRWADLESRPMEARAAWAGVFVLSGVLTWTFWRGRR